MATKEAEKHEEAGYSDPLYLAASDNPAIQISSMIFNGSNFLNWTRSVKMSLGAKNKQGFIDGTCKRPQPSSKEYSKWVRCDYMVRCWLFKSMSDKIAESLMLCESAKQIWDEIYESGNKFAANAVKKESEDCDETPLEAGGFLGDENEKGGGSSSLNAIAGIVTIFNARETIKLFDRNTWIVDSGAFDHRTGNIELLMNLKPLMKPIHVGLPDGSTKLLSSHGDVEVMPNLMLRNVLYVCDFSQNLLSLSKLIEERDIRILFDKFGRKFQDPSNGKELGEAKKVNGLYELETGEYENAREQENGKKKHSRKCGEDENIQELENEAEEAMMDQEEENEELEEDQQGEEVTPVKE
ncbi:Retrovirus-related Pol polyprotein from transposon RE1 [Bienertia sinuspersici]